MSDRYTGLWPTPKATDGIQGANRTGRATTAQTVKAGWNLIEAVRAVGVPVSNQLTLFAEAFPVSPIPWLVDVADLPTSATSGPTSPDSFASVNPDGSWRKTSQGYSQVTLDGSLEVFLETWPRAGMTLSGKAYRLPPLERCTDATASGSWPTPCSQDDNKSPEAHLRMKANMPGGPRHTITSLQVMVKAIDRGLWPTPASSTAIGGPHGLGGGSAAKGSGALNPNWVELLMGYPKGWTEV